MKDKIRKFKVKEFENSPVRIRDFNVKIIGDKTYLGAELECKNSNYYDSKLEVKFVKNDEIVHEEEVKIPTLIGDGIFFVGKTFDYTDYDEVRLKRTLGKVLYEESFYPDTVFEFDKEKSNQKHLEYKIENNSTKPFSYATLSLLFYNRGKLICGADVTMKNLLNERAYYFTYDIPEEIEFTDVKTELMLPATDNYLFKSFYNKYREYEKSINADQKPVLRKSHEVYVDNTDKLKKSLEKAQKERKEKEKLKTKKEIPKVVALKSLLYLVISAAIGFGIMVAGLFVYAILKVMFKAPEPNDLVLTIIYIVVSLIVFAKIWYDKWSQFNSYITVEEKEKKLKESDNFIKYLEREIKDLTDNKNKYINKVERKNKEIDNYNKQMDELEEKRKNNLAETRKEFEVFKAKYPEYRVIENYDSIDMGFVDAAISQGAITWESVEMYRREAKKAYEEDEKFKLELQELKKRNQLIAEQTNAIKASTEQRMRDEMLMREQVAENARRHDSLVMQQINEQEKLYKQRERHNSQIITELNDLRYQEYLFDRYPSYWNKD